MHRLKSHIGWLRACTITITAAMLALTAMAAPAPAPALAGDTGGTCRHKGQDFTFVDGVYFTEPNAFDQAKQDRVLAFSSVLLDKVAIGRAADKEDAIRDQVWDAKDGARIQLSINDEDAVWAMQFNASGTSLSQSGSGVGALTLTSKTDDALSGTFKLEGDNDDLNCDLRFGLAVGEAAAAVAAAPPLPKGKPIAAGGGEIGKAYMANFNAMRRGDIDGLLATAAADTRKQMDEARKDPDFPKMLEIMKAFAPASIKITGGQDFGSTAELTLEGSDTDGVKSTGTATMVKEGSDWKVEGTSMKSG